MRKLKNVIEIINFSKKEIKILIIIICIGIISGTALLIFDHRPIQLELERGTYGGSDREEELEVKIGDGKEETVEVVIGEREYTKSERDELFQKVEKELEKEMLGENDSLDYVTKDLNFMEQIEGYPVEISWQWSPYQVVSIDGAIKEEFISQEGTIVEIKAKMTYLEEEVEYMQHAAIYPREIETKLGDKEQLEVALKEAEESSRTKATFLLPEELDGKELKWYQESDLRGMVLIFLGTSVVVLLGYKKKREAEKKVEENKEQMMQDYPEIVNTFVIYIGAGMTVKNAWGKIVGQYQKKEESRVAFEELKTTYIEMKNGVAEVEAYERFGKRCEVKSYRKFSSIIIQNVKMGTKGMSLLLEYEAREAFEERKNRAKILGERAGTKMLMPMFLMLVVVLVILVIPAFLSIQI